MTIFVDASGMDNIISDATCREIEFRSGPRLKKRKLGSVWGLSGDLVSNQEDISLEHVLFILDPFPYNALFYMIVYSLFWHRFRIMLYFLAPLPFNDLFSMITYSLFWSRFRVMLNLP